MDAKDEIKARLPIEQLVAQYCQLKKKGRNYVCLCPFHSDKHPSFLVSPDKGIGYCFACQTGGDIFSFIQKIENVDFPTAVKMLAEKAGVEIPAYRQASTPSVSKDEKQRLRECLEAAAELYTRNLKETPEALAYVKGRGVTDELLKTFGIGYAPDSYSATYDALLRKGFSRSEIVGSGLGVQREISDQKIYDRFRHRIMFPISDAQGHIVGFGGRAMGESDAKYVNSPESILYKKSAVLFGLFQARDAIRAARRIVLVEGYFDAVAAHKAGIQNVVAVSGTALTEEHVQVIKRYADDVILCLDQDNAGELAAARAFGLLSSANLKIHSVTLPAKDPDELVQRDAAMFRSLIETSSRPYIDAVIERLKAEPDIAEPSGKRNISDTLFPLFQSLRASTELRAYLQKAAQSFGMLESEFSADFRSWSGALVHGRKADVSKTPMFSGSVPEDAAGGMDHGSEPAYSRHDLCIGLAGAYPVLRPFLRELIVTDDAFIEESKRALLEGDLSLSIHAIAEAMNLEFPGKEKLKVLSLYCEEMFPLWSETMAQREFKKMTASANKEIVTRKQLSIARQLRDARGRGRPDEEAKLLTQYQQVVGLSKMAERGA